MAKSLTSIDRILQAVLQDEKLREICPFNPSDYETVQDALISDNFLVCTIAKIIDVKNENNKEKKSDKQLYNEIINYLNMKI